MANEKLLKDLKIYELKSELEDRDLDTIRIKIQLVKRLIEALVYEGKNPDKYRFGCAEDEDEENSRKIKKKQWNIPGK